MNSILHRKSLLAMAFIVAVGGSPAIALSEQEVKIEVGSTALEGSSIIARFSAATSFPKSTPFWTVNITRDGQPLRQVKDDAATDAAQDTYSVSASELTGTLKIANCQAGIYLIDIQVIWVTVANEAPLSEVARHQARESVVVGNTAHDASGTPVAAVPNDKLTGNQRYSSLNAADQQLVKDLLKKLREAKLIDVFAKRVENNDYSAVLKDLQKINDDALSNSAIANDFGKLKNEVGPGKKKVVEAFAQRVIPVPTPNTTSIVVIRWTNALRAMSDAYAAAKNIDNQWGDATKLAELQAFLRLQSIAFEIEAGAAPAILTAEQEAFAKILASNPQLANQLFGQPAPANRTNRDRSKRASNAPCFWLFGY